MELKKCPCCAGQAEIYDIKFAKLVHKYGVRCVNCGLQTPSFWDEKKAFRIWNRRPMHDDITQAGSNEEIMGYTK